MLNNEKNGYPVKLIQKILLDKWVSLNVQLFITISELLQILHTADYKLIIQATHARMHDSYHKSNSKTSEGSKVCNDIFQ